MSDKIREERTRLKWYYRKKDGHIVSEPVLCGHHIVYVVIDPVELKLKIMDIEDKKHFVYVKGESIKKLKKEGKNKLVKLSAKFFDEVRLGKKGKKKNG